MRPYVICHLLTSLDGKIDGEWFSRPEVASIYPYNKKIRENYKTHAVMNGTTTCASIYADGYIDTLPHTKNHYSRYDHIVRQDLKDYVICLDFNGELKYHRNYIDRPSQPMSHIVEVLSENVSDDYIEYLQSLQISYIFAGKESLDIPLLMDKLYRLLHIDRLLVTGGGILDYSLLVDDCLDELSLLVAPVIDGDKSTAGIFEQTSFTPALSFGFTLDKAKRIDKNGLWLVYKRG